MPGLDCKMQHSFIIRLFGDDTDSSLVFCSSHIHPLAQSVAMPFNGRVPPDVPVRNSCIQFRRSYRHPLSPRNDTCWTHGWHIGTTSEVQHNFEQCPILAPRSTGILNVKLSVPGKCVTWKNVQRIAWCVAAELIQNLRVYCIQCFSIEGNREHSKPAF